MVMIRPPALTCLALHYNNTLRIPMMLPPIGYALAAGLSVVGLSALAHGQTEFCESFKRNRHITTEEAEEQVGPWFQDQFDEWESSYKDEEPRFWSWFHHKYAPGTAETILDCKLDGTCSPVDCSLVSDEFSLEVQHNAFHAMESVANFHNTMWAIKRANVEAFNGVESNMQALMNQFSDGANVEKQRADFQEHMKLLMHAIIAVTLLLSAITGAASAAIGLMTATAEQATAAGVIEGVVEVADPWAKLVAKNTALAGAKWTVAGAVFNAMSGVEVGTVSVITDLISGPDYAMKLQTAAKQAMSQNQHITAKLFDANMISLLNGTDGVTNMTLVDIVRSGRYANTTEIVPAFRDQLRALWTASAISTIWSTEHSYIVASDVSSGGCESDRRGPQALKSCVVAYPNKVFYTYFKSNCREGIQGQALLRGPPGHELLKQATNFTLDDVVASSMTHLEAHGNQQLRPMVGTEGFETLFGNASATARGGGNARGIFMLPVCYTPGGQAISSINLKKGRNLPCMCSNFDFPGERLLAAGLQPRSQLQAAKRRSAKRGGWTGDIQASYNFIYSSGLYESKNFHRLCTHRRGARREHGNSCKQDKSITWTWGSGGIEEGKETMGDTNLAVAAGKKPKKNGRTQHPYKKCKSNKHKYVGCEKPNNDGHKQNKKCSKEAMEFADSSLITAGVYGMNATWSNSDYIDYDVDFGIDSDTDEEEHFEAS
ncbi:hypothetical protein D6D29_03681, partial [Aureobasidium pullulans]